jgi:hypothetical protein
MKYYEYGTLPLQVKITFKRSDNGESVKRCIREIENKVYITITGKRYRVYKENGVRFVEIA